jgi:SAM-dependent methyltransferase
MRHILRVIREYRPAGRLLDVGAASGILVEEALKMGYSAEGVEPSRVFCEEARTRGLPVHPGTLPQTGVRGPFDVITLIDVIEHVPDPVRLLRETRPLLADGGIGVAVTPDAGSLAARLMGSRWWHYRVAHLCYFTRRTLGMALDAAGLLPLHFQRAGWVFPADYLWERLGRYLPPRLRMRPWPIMSRVAVRLNLLDSFLVVYQKK